MKTIVINYLGKKGGGAAYAYEMAKALVDNGHNVIAIISEYIENKHLWEELPLGKIIYVKTYKRHIDFILRTVIFTLFTRWSISKKLSNMKIDCVYVPMIQPWSGFVNNLFKKTNKVIVTLHDPESHSGENNLIFNTLVNYCINRSSDIIVLSDRFRELTSHKYSFPIENVHVIPHGDFKYYKNVQKKVESSDYSDENINFLFFGRISKYKGLDVLSKAYEMVSKVITNATLTIAGSGSFKEYESEFVNLQNVRIINKWFTDEEVGNLFEGSNIITVLPYIDATQSGVIPIAIEYGSTIIASDTGGLSEQISHNNTGILVETGNPVALAESMIMLAKDKELRNNLSANAYKANEANAWNKCADKLIDILE